MYETYTQSFNLEKIDKQISLLERLYALKDASPSSDAELKTAYEAIKQNLNRTMGEAGVIPEVPSWLKKFVAAVVGWVITGTIFGLASDKASRSNVVFGMAVVAIPFCFISSIIPTVAGWFNYILIPIFQIGFVLVIAYLASKKPKNA